MRWSEIWCAFPEEQLECPFFSNTQSTYLSTQGTSASLQMLPSWKGGTERKNCFLWALTCCVRQRMIPKRLTGLRYRVAHLISSWRLSVIILGAAHNLTTVEESSVLPAAQQSKKGWFGVRFYASGWIYIPFAFGRRAASTCNLRNSMMGGTTLPKWSVTESETSNLTMWHLWMLRERFFYQ